MVVDFPDPSNYSIGKLYSLTFYRRLSEVLAPNGWAVIQSTSPYVAPKAFWCVERTLQAAGLQTAAYHVFVPSFGEWGFVAAGHVPYRLPTSLPAGLRFVTAQSLPALFDFPLGHAARTDGDQPARQSGAGTLFREGVGETTLLNSAMHGAAD